MDSSLLKQLDKLIAEKDHPEFIVVDEKTYRELSLLYEKSFPCRPTKRLISYRGIPFSVVLRRMKVIQIFEKII